MQDRQREADLPGVATASASREPASAGPGRAVAAAVAVLTAAIAATVPATAADACWLPPVHGRIVDPYREPPCRWCAGNRGIEYAVGPGTVVRAVASGVVTYSGVVVGTRYVVVDIGAGRRITYGQLASSRVRRGDRVAARSVVGTASVRLFFGLRIHGEYTDPTRLIGHPVGRPRLVPSDGSAARPAPPPRLRCGPK